MVINALYCVKLKYPATHKKNAKNCIANILNYPDDNAEKDWKY